MWCTTLNRNRPPWRTINRCIKEIVQVQDVDVSRLKTQAKWGKRNGEKPEAHGK